MMNDKHLPEKLLDMLSRYDWDTLSPEAQTEISTWISEEEYTQLRRAYTGLRAQNETPVPALRPESKQAVLQAFRKQQKPAATTVQLPYARIPVWQAAAAALLLFAAGYTLRPVEVRVIQNPQSTLRIDTVYIKQEAAVMPAAGILSDSIASADLPPASRSSAASSKRRSIRQYPGRSYGTRAIPAQSLDLNILRLEDSRSISPSGKNWQEDSLGSAFGFVQI